MGPRRHALLFQFSSFICLPTPAYRIDVAVLLLVAIFACYAGLLLWMLFLRLDSLRYPLKTYGDVAERILGKAARHICTFLQTLQLIVLVGIQCNRSPCDLHLTGRHCLPYEWASVVADCQGERKLSRPAQLVQSDGCRSSASHSASLSSPSSVYSSDSCERLG